MDVYFLTAAFVFDSFFEAIKKIYITTVHVKVVYEL